MRNLKTYSILILLLALISISVGLTNDEIDPGPYLVYLKDVLNNILNEEYLLAMNRSIIAMNFDLPERIKLNNKLLYTYLYDVSRLLYKISSGNYTREDAYELYRLRFRLDKILEGYIYSMTNMVPDKATGYVLRKQLLFIKNTLMEMIEYIVVLAFNKIGGKYIVSKLIVPPKVVPGTTIASKLIVEANTTTTTIEQLNITLSVTAGFYRGRSTYTASNLEARNGKLVFPISINVPGTEKTISMPRTIVFTALVEIITENKTVRGFTINRSLYVFEEPLIFFDIPAIVRPGGNLTLRIYSKAIYPLNATLYIDVVDEEHYLSMITIYPGLHKYTVPFQNVSRGIHTLFIHVDPYGRYISVGYSKALAVTGVPADVKTIMPDFILAPPYDMIISVTTNTLGILRVYIGDKLIYNGTIDKARTVKLKLPWALTINNYRVKIVLIPLNKTYDTYTGLFTVYVLNLPVTAMIAGLLSYLLLIVSDKNRLLLLKLYIETITPIVKSKKLVEELLPRLEMLLKTRIHSWETLREYYSRVSNELSLEARRVLWSMITLYEEYRYSNHKVNLSILQKYFRTLWKQLRLHTS